MRHFTHGGERIVLALLWGMLAAGVPAGAGAEPRETASEVLDATGVKGGLIVHLGCGDGRLTTALRANDRYLIHGLDADAKNIQKARKYIQPLALYGKVSVEHWQCDDLPYADNLVNLLVAEDLGKVSMAEVMRVLAPLGVVYIKGPDGRRGRRAQVGPGGPQCL